ncbi:hypothetical protein MES4922_20296 [Mesorhizobium ventifaucium]|uniref:Secreted protein n=1 Tax=Mesorhizobium ventifaucium TaxID=666020 RepID=A0ABN8JMF1_9HYPH|nr:hypothetical protein MES4922_20296 [Mesorhizobium ventifaucium]
MLGVPAAVPLGAAGRVVPALSVNVLLSDGFLAFPNKQGNLTKHGNFAEPAKLKHKRVGATSKRNICDAKVTLAGMPTNCMERPRISRIPATNQGLFDQRLTSCSPSIHASTL